MPGKQIAFNSKGKKNHLSRVIKIHLQYLSLRYSHSFTANSLTMLERKTLLRVPQETLHSISKENFALKTFPPITYINFPFLEKRTTKGRGEGEKSTKGRRSKQLLVLIIS